MTRRLYLVPIIHTSPDMGSLAPALDKRAAAELGHALWQRHQQTIAGLWSSIARFIDSLNVSGFKVYQDGLVADYAEGLRIVKAGASQGSRNYEIIARLLERGAILVKTEQLTLVQQEHDYITKMTQAKSGKETESAILRYKLAQSQLLKQRDDFIARTIDETMEEGDNGLLFIGASHDVLSRLPDSIRVDQVKDVALVREYHHLLLTVKRRGHRFQQLAEYLVSPVTVSTA